MCYWIWLQTWLLILPTVVILFSSFEHRLILQTLHIRHKHVCCIQVQCVHIFTLDFQQIIVCCYLKHCYYPIYLHGLCLSLGIIHSFLRSHLLPCSVRVLFYWHCSQIVCLEHSYCTPNLFCLLYCKFMLLRVLAAINEKRR